MSTLNNTIVKFVELLPKPIVKIFAQRYIAGDTLQDAIRVVKELNSRGIYATMDVLGEAIQTKSEALQAKKECLEVLEAIKDNNLMANLSVKPTQLGLALDKEYGLKETAEVVARAKELNNFVRLDMEDSPYTDATFELLKCLREKFDNVGVVVQAYLKRTLSDVQLLNKIGTNYRLCKGIYIEPEEIAYKDKQKIRDNYLEILKTMLKDGNYVGIATHDDYLVNGALKLLKELNVPKDKYEFQMLYGVKEDLRDKINEAGHKIRIYVPFGKQWYKYSIRRLKENPQVAWYITKSIFMFK
ncbi:MAG: proline dehydrogenase family protein [Bacteroidota bacterium]|nr:proline dehydrogenase [Ignavibacteria bacterium]MCU7500399.1 proline dehydrogenase [Ignavibacteria bacterium]MCU7512753.1 proline dehydrogenase [Ignavibacteria bacterium]MCU7520365.1 proline dehydrogenase [Ignavibacteria bacterium]MCU7523968.1 proline dehydrogenase [Ignavibacteria bacterium]